MIHVRRPMMSRCGWLNECIYLGCRCKQTRVNGAYPNRRMCGTFSFCVWKVPVSSDRFATLFYNSINTKRLLSPPYSSSSKPRRSPLLDIYIYLPSTFHPLPHIGRLWAFFCVPNHLFPWLPGRTVQKKPVILGSYRIL